LERVKDELLDVTRQRFFLPDNIPGTINQDVAHPCVVFRGEREALPTDGSGLVEDVVDDIKGGTLRRRTVRRDRFRGYSRFNSEGGKLGKDHRLRSSFSPLLDYPPGSTFLPRRARRPGPLVDSSVVWVPQVIPGIAQIRHIELCYSAAGPFARGCGSFSLYSNEFRRT